MGTLFWTWNKVSRRTSLTERRRRQLNSTVKETPHFMNLSSLGICLNIVRDYTRITGYKPCNNVSINNTTWRVACPVDAKVIREALYICTDFSSSFQATVLFQTKGDLIANSIKWRLFSDSASNRRPTRWVSCYSKADRVSPDKVMRKLKKSTTTLHLGLGR